MSEFAFPDNFLWGTSTAGHQVEGQNLNSESWVLEHLPETIYAEPSGDACDHYHRYPDDIAMLADLGFNSYRFSIEWSRIEPVEGEFSLAALDHYRRMLACCHENGISPMVTFHHFISPAWLMRDGGWLSSKTPDRFVRYAEKAAAHLGDLIGTACTFNEPNIAVVLSKMLPFSIQKTPFWKNAADAFGVTPDRLGLWQFVYDPAMWDIIHKTHLRVRDILHAGPGSYPVGLTLAMMDIHTAEGGESTAAQFRRELSDNYLERLTDDDFVGVQTYSRMVVGPDGLVHPPEGSEITQMHEEFYPEAIEGTVRYASSVAGIPVYVTENGLPMEDDSRRVEYFKRAVPGVARCMQDGIDVRGYFCWSLMDNFEWISGYGPKFGIVAVDRKTLKRTPKPSASVLGGIARANRVEW